MGILDLFKVAKDLLMGESSQAEEKFSTRNEYVDDAETFTDDEDMDVDDDDEDEDKGISPIALAKFEAALHIFYTKLSQKELNDPELSRITEKVQDDYFDGKIKDPLKALNSTYKEWKHPTPEQQAKRKSVSQNILSNLSKYDDLTEDEQYTVRAEQIERLHKGDYQAAKAIVDEWVRSKTLNEDKIGMMKDLESKFEKEIFSPVFPTKETPLDELEFQQQMLIFGEYILDDGTLIRDHVEDYYDYAKRYYASPEHHPQPLDIDDLIVKRSCYYKAELMLETPHFHMGKRYFERDSHQKVVAYLFADALEIMADGGRIVVTLADIIELKFNNWEDHYYSMVDSPDDNEDDMLEITTTNGKTLLSYSSDGHSALIKLSAMIHYFIKNPQS